MSERTCTVCVEPRPWPAGFAKDARSKTGHRGVCKICERKATRARRADARVGRKPGALVLAPKFPAPPEIPSPLAVVASSTTQPTEQPGGAGSYSEAAEMFIAALDPPAADADAVLVHSLRGLADLADRFSLGADIVRDINALVTGMLRVQRELAATRLAKAKPAVVEEKPAPRSAANY